MKSYKHEMIMCIVNTGFSEAVTRLSCRVSGGRMDGRRFAIMDFPLPGGPTIIRL